MIDRRTAPRRTNGSIIARLRIERGLTQAQLAVQIGVHKNRICDWEKGKFKPRGENLLRLADALNCDARELIQK